MVEHAEKQLNFVIKVEGIGSEQVQEGESGMAGTWGMRGSHGYPF
jgi:hypothetical protein